MLVFKTVSWRWAGSALISFLCGCYAPLININELEVKALSPASHTPRLVSENRNPQGTFSLALSYNPVNELGYNGGEHTPVDENGDFYTLTRQGALSGKGGYEILVSIHPACSLEFKGSNIVVKTPRWYGTVTADFGPFIKYISVHTETEFGLSDNVFLINIKVGPAVTYAFNHLGVGFNLVFTAGVFERSAEIIEISGLPDNVTIINNTEKDRTHLTLGVAPVFVINNLEPVLGFRAFSQCGFQYYSPYFSTSPPYNDYSDARETVSVNVRYLFLSAGLERTLGQLRWLAGGRMVHQTVAQSRENVASTFFTNISWSFDYSRIIGD